MGENFLDDQNLARWIVAQLEAEPGEQWVEIGPGLGALTQAALETGAKLIAIEKDRRLAGFLRERFADGLRVENLDALDFDVRSLWPWQPVKAFGNLPYYISTPLLFHFTSPASPVERAVFLLQRELAQRLAAAGPGTKDYGSLSLVVARRWRIRLLRTLPAGVFTPEPKVDSALVSLELRPPGELPACDAVTFERIVRAGFSQRRKQLRKLIPDFADGSWPACAERLGVPEAARGEELDLGQWISLANLLRPVEPAAAQDTAGEWFDVVDENDLVTGAETRGAVHARGLRHRAIHILVFNPAGDEVFLQKRSAWKDRHPGKWDSSAAGHLDRGEDYASAARRELREELGLAAGAPALEEMGRLPATESTGWEFIRLFRATHAGPFRWPPEEIEWGGFFPRAVVTQWIERRPQDFAPGFLQCWEIVGRREEP